MQKGKATKKPVEVNWFKWEGELKSLSNWCKSFNEDFRNKFITKERTLKVKTLEGTSYNVPEGYIIIRGIQGEYYPCDPEIFKQTYNINYV